MKNKLFILVLLMTIGVLSHIISTFYFLLSPLHAFPISEYDFRLPTSSPSAVEAAYGGLNVASSKDMFLIFTNPSLIRNIREATFGVSFAVPPKDYDNFNQAMSSLDNSRLRAFAFQTKQIGLGYLVLADEKSTTDISEDLTVIANEYMDYRLNAWAISFTDSVGGFFWGVTGKLITGRIVYNRDLENEFIDSDALGYSFDLGMSTSAGGFTGGLAVYDIFSEIYWKDYGMGKIRTRMGLGLDFNSGTYFIGAGMNSIWGFKEDPHYNAYYGYRFNFSNGETINQTTFRFGLVGQKFEKQDDIFFCLGLGYDYAVVQFDIGLQSKGWKANESQVMFSFSMGR